MAPSIPDPNVLIVDDEPDIRELLSLTLAKMDLGSTAAGTIAQAQEVLAHSDFDLCLTDMRLPDGNGIDLVRHIQQSYPEMPVAVITAFGSMDTAVEALKAGAFDFVSKPVQLDELRALVKSALKLSEQAPQARRSRYALLGSSEPMRQIRAMIAKLARSQAPVYIRGESGTGKELVARLIHEKSARAEEAFVAVNCGAIPAELMESEFFGHKKGSFTGAVADKPGLFQAANRGTLFLDELAELPTDMQVKLLRAIQEKAVRPVGEQREIPVNVRILSASQVDLAELVRQGRFRQDFYYRINVIELQIPPLRRRDNDVRELAQHFLDRLSLKTGVKARLGEQALTALEKYPFPGNVRELENILERALALCDGEEIRVSDLGLPDIDMMHGAGVQNFEPGEEALDEYLARIEKDALIRALNQTSQNKTAAAKLLGMTFRSFRYKLEKHGIR